MPPISYVYLLPLSQMVVQFSDKCIDCGKMCRLRQKDLEHFSSRFSALTKDEVAVALLVSGRDILGMLPLMVPCVGCRKRYACLFLVSYILTSVFCSFYNSFLLLNGL